VRFGLNGPILSVILAGVLIPIIALMVPYFQLVSRLGLYDRLIALILTYAAINLPVSVFLIHGFMAGIPRELEEAAVIDGCSFAQRFSRIIFPLSRLGVVTAGTFVFLYAWNEFIYALLLTSSVRARTLQLGIRFFRSQFVTDYTSMYAALVVSMVPSILVYVLFHEKIIRGLTSGALKG
jgi:raffinose/stachyose/melibiose transport system permease protein